LICGIISRGDELNSKRDRKNAENARGITGKAVTQAGSATAKVDELGKSAKKIGKVTEA
jgi:methyl-accepting chemotaxis protein